jgi:hypothetical protein
MAQAPQPIRINWPAIYTAQHAALSPAKVDEILAKGRQSRLGDLLRAGGVVVFPHAAVLDCGYQVAAAVNAALDSGLPKVLVISVLHAWTESMSDARNRLAAGEDMTEHPLRGIQGPDMPNSRDEWRLDHALISWRFFWQAECERRSIPAARRPQVREVYPFLSGSEPQTLAHFDEIAEWANGAAIVSTADPFHHGIGYGDSKEVARAPEDGGLELARASIIEGNRLLAAGDYSGYLYHCVRARNDARDAGPLLHALVGPIQPEILDLTSSDMAEIYDAPPPTWVAAALVSWRP